jgi:uncharacterized membrane protein HdeD (DUF308 family)
MPTLLVSRAALALLWAAALLLAVGDRVPTTDADLPIAAAALLTTYPLIDAVASVVVAGRQGAAQRVLRVNAAISAAAAVAVGIAAFGSTAGATLAAFGVWAAVSGAIQFGVALHRRHRDGGQVAMLVSGGLSTIAGVSFLSAAGMDEAHLATLGGYMALGAVLYLVSARRRRPQEAAAQR